MNIFSLPATIAFLVNFSIGMLVLLDNPRHSLNRWFSGFVFLFAVWNLAEIILLNSINYKGALFAAQLLYRVLFIIPAIFFIISLIFPPKNYLAHRKEWLTVLIIVVPIVLLALSFPNFNITPVPFSPDREFYYYRFTFTFNWPLITLMVISAGYILAGSFVLVHKLQIARTTKEKTKIKFLLIGVLVIFISYIFINISSISHRVLSLYFFMALLTLFISFFFFMAITYNKIIRLSRLISGGISYTLLSSIILTIYFLIIKGLSNTLGNIFNISSFLFESLLILTLIIIFSPLESRLERVVNKMLYRGIYQFRRNFVTFSEELLHCLNNNDLFNKITKFLQDNFKLDEIFIFYYDPTNDKYKLWNEGEQDITISKDSYLVQTLMKRKTIQEFYDMEFYKCTDDSFQFFTGKKISLIIPLIYGTNLLSFILLPEKKANRLFSQEEIEVLQIFANEVVNALIRNIYIEKIQEEEREKASMERLADIGTLTASVAHEIRNPLNTITTSAQTLKEMHLDPEEQKDLLGFIIEEAQRLNGILNDFLRLSKIRNVTLAETTTDEIIQSIEYQTASYQNQDIELTIENHLKGEKIIIDKNLILQVLENLIINAIDAIKQKKSTDPAHKGYIKLIIKRIKTSIFFIVEDNGQAIPKDIEKKIFKPFFTTKDNGTGLGLAISQNLVKYLNGKLYLRNMDTRKQFIVEIPQITKLTANDLQSQ